MSKLDLKFIIASFATVLAVCISMFFILGMAVYTLGILNAYL